jgi:glycosyltransferase involved in cell wall biosynthesis
MKSRKSNKVLLILNLPPPYGGGEIRSKYLFDYLSNNEKYIIIPVSRIKSNKSTSGKLNISNILFGLKINFKAIFYIIYFRPEKIYLSIPKQFNPFIKTIPIISAANLFKIKIYGELAGDSFLFLKENNYKKKLGLFFLKKISDLRVLGPSIKKKLSPLKITNLTVFDNGIYVPNEIKITTNSFFNPVLNLLFVGALNYSKGIKNLIESIYLLKKEEVKVHLHLMGEWSTKIQKSEILNFINSNDLNEFITFHGLVTTELKWEIYQKCQILVHPTFWDGQPLVILEAMGCGLGIISTKIGAIPDTIKNKYNGIILDENTKTELYNTIKYFYDNRQKIVEISNNNIRTYNEKYTIDSFLMRMVNWLES